jgi:hypothetical protein
MASRGPSNTGYLTGADTLGRDKFKTPKSGGGKPPFRGAGGKPPGAPHAIPEAMKDSIRRVGLDAPFSRTFRRMGSR